MGSMLFDVSLSNIILDKSQAKATKAKINGTIATKNYCTVKETVSIMKRQCTECEKIFVNDISGRS